MLFATASDAMAWNPVRQSMLVTIYAPEDVHALEIASIRDALFEANQRMRSGDRYEVRLVAERAEPLRCASGLLLMPDSGIGEDIGAPDTLIVVGAYGVPTLPVEAVTEWLRVRSSGARRYGAVCTGAFCLAAAGLLDGRRVTTHWQYAERLAAEYPELAVEPDAIFVRDGPVFTSAGVVAALDLVLSLIEEDHGRELALWVARRLVIFLKRPGGQSQFSVHLTGGSAGAPAMDRVRQHIIDAPGADLGSSALARFVGMSERSLARLFKAQTGMNPSLYVELSRLDIARRLLEQSDLPLKAVAHEAGFGSVASLRRAFQRRLSLTPIDYRRRFRSTGQT
jgi:transcriptional regulator GlxA family with amidase domain